MIGRLEVICGPMYSGKSEELLRRLRRHRIAGRNVLLIKPSIDDRYDDDLVVSHNGSRMEAFSASSPEEIYSRGREFDVIGIDEVQFFESPFITLIIKRLIDVHKIVIVSGLDMTYRKDPFNPLPELMAISDTVDKFSAICNICGEDALYTQRLHDGHPAKFDEDTIVVGGKEQYEARCRAHFEIG